MARVSRDAALMAAAAAIAIAGRLYFGVMTSDDAYITFRYARNIATHHAFVYNHDERVLGTSTPLYAVMMAGVATLGLPLEKTSTLIGIACDALTVALLYRMIARAGFGDAAALGAAMTGAISMGIAPASAGMETPLYNLLLLLTFEAGRAAVDTGSSIRPALLAVTLGICRPEAVLAIGVIVAGLGVSRPRVALRVAIIGLAFALPLVAAAHWYYGNLVPQSVVAKASFTERSWAGVSLFGQFLFSRSHVIPTVLAIAGAVSLARADRIWRWMIVWWIAYAAAFSVTGAFPHASWYFVPLLPLYWASVAVGLANIVTRYCPPRVSRSVFTGAAVALLATTIAHWPGYRAALMQVNAIRERPYLEIGSSIARSARPCNVAATEIGAVGWAFPGRIIDLGGLVTPDAVRRPPGDVLRDTDAQWLVTQNIYLPHALAQDASFHQSYSLVQSMPLEAGRTMDVYKRIAGSCGGG
jgi:arabinofuranosyltransferase